MELLRYQKLPVPQHLKDNFDLAFKPLLVTETRVSVIDGVSPVLVIGLAYKDNYFEELIPFANLPENDEEQSKVVEAAAKRLSDLMRPVLMREEIIVVPS